MWDENQDLAIAMLVRGRAQVCSQAPAWLSRPMAEMTVECRPWRRVHLRMESDQCMRVEFSMGMALVLERASAGSSSSAAKVWVRYPGKRFLTIGPDFNTLTPPHFSLHVDLCHSIIHRNLMLGVEGLPARHETLRAGAA